ncbi:DHA2 family efflux MFS transporter permease subunit [Glaesserella sp.]|uniref:DHA2 family efflux MFS transporter permease subunit n=1 Tax=Glaesserella sp. TaxID=2094731 RepID=UPI0035A17A1E
MSEQTNHRGLAWTAAIAFFMLLLDSTILNTALPAISESLNESPLEMQLAVISYALSVATFIPLSGWLADRLGTLTLFRFSTLLFALGSIACALSDSLAMLVLARIIQGIGGAFMMPVARLSILRIVPKSQLVPTWNLIAMAGLIGPVTGPIVGGWLVTNASWHWIFWINVPISLIGIGAAGKFMPNVKGEKTRLDIVGFLLLAFGLVAFTYGLERLANNLQKTDTALGILSVGIIATIAYVIYARKISDPLFPLSLFHIRTFRIGLTANLLFRLVTFSVPFLLPIMLQVSFHYSAEAAGWMLAPMAISSIFAKPITARILNRFGYKKTLLLASAITGVSTASFGLLDLNTSFGILVIAIMFYGAITSLMFTSINTLCVGDLEQETASTGSTMLSMVQQIGSGIGVAVAAVLLSAYRLQIGESTSTQLQQAFGYTFFSTAICCLLLVWTVSRLHDTDGENLKQRKE